MVPLFVVVISAPSYHIGVPSEQEASSDGDEATKRTTYPSRYILDTAKEAFKPTDVSGPELICLVIALVDVVDMVDHVCSACWRRGSISTFILCCGGPIDEFKTRLARMIPLMVIE